MSGSTTIIGPLFRRRLTVTGIVQGVGFRPAVYRLARSMALSGWVRNDGHGVTIDIQGEQAAVEAFPEALRRAAPAPSSIHGIDVADLAPEGGRVDAFMIDVSDMGHPADTMIAPDMATCPDCLAELIDPGDRRFGYAFLNCTNCGPRYTIVRRIPYDRPHTSMASFEQCPDCQVEYDDPLDRRFHAQPNACGVCGPRLILLKDGREINTDDPIAEVQSALAAGRIVAIRGIGGFHLAVDPANTAAVSRLRQRKRRTEKPFALMARDLDVVGRYAGVSAQEESLLTDPARPIVLLSRCENAFRLSDGVAPGQNTLAFMLPYAPLHHLLLAGSLDVLVMTSANLAEEPIITHHSGSSALDDGNALEGLADLVLTHDRDIVQRCDDSILRSGPHGPFPVRRSRGYVPAPIRLTHAVPRPMLAVGGHLKNTIALARGREVVLSQHIGDLDNPSALRFFEETIDHMCHILQIEPDIIVADLHPDYQSTRWARQSGMPVLGVQHHHAHFAATLAEHGQTGPAIGLILDGTGYGEDGTIWGGEILAGTTAGNRRLAHLQHMQIPGSEQAIKEPWRLAAALLRRLRGPSWMDTTLPGVLASRSQEELMLVDRMMEREVNAPFTSSAGRLFDGVSALLGVRETVTYEAQAAIELETLASTATATLDSPPEPVGFLQDGVVVTDDLIAGLLESADKGTPHAVIAARFHQQLALRLASAVSEVSKQTGIHTCALSGGVIQNRILLDHLTRFLETAGLEVLLPDRIPPNDGGLAFGQIAAAAARMHEPEPLSIGDAVSSIASAFDH